MLDVLNTPPTATLVFPAARCAVPVTDDQISLLLGDPGTADLDLDPADPAHPARLRLHAGQLQVQPVPGEPFIPVTLTDRQRQVLGDPHWHLGLLNCEPGGANLYARQVVPTCTVMFAADTTGPSRTLVLALTLSADGHGLTERVQAFIAFSQVDAVLNALRADSVVIHDFDCAGGGCSVQHGTLFGAGERTRRAYALHVTVADLTTWHASSLAALRARQAQSAH